MSGSSRVAAGIFSSRVVGLGREILIGGILGRSITAEAFRVAMRVPNMIQNLLGEGAISASFVPRPFGCAGRAPRGADDRVRSTLGLAGHSGQLVRPAIRVGHRPHPYHCRRCRTAGARIVVPGDSQQPPPVLPALRGSDVVEWQPDRRPHRDPGLHRFGRSGNQPKRSDLAGWCHRRRGRPRRVRATSRYLEAAGGCTAHDGKCETGSHACG